MIPEPQPRSSGIPRWWGILLICAASLIISESLYQRVQSRIAGSHAARSGESQPLPPSVLASQLRELQAKLSHYTELAPEDLRAEIEKNPALVALVTLCLAMPVLVFLGLVLFIWFLVRVQKRRPVFAQAEGIEPKWSVWDAIVVLSFLIVVRRVFYQAVPDSSYKNVIVGFLVYLSSCLFGWYVVRVRYRQPAKAMGFRTDALGRNLGRGILAYVAGYPLFVAAALINMVIATRLLGGGAVSGGGAIRYLTQAESPALIALIAVLFVFIGPLAEEFLFRGLLYGALRKRLSARGAIGLSAVVFAGFHLNPYQFLPLCMIGLILGYLYEKTRSLVPTVFVHMLQNALAVLFVCLLKLAL